MAMGWTQGVIYLSWGKPSPRAPIWAPSSRQHTGAGGGLFFTLQHPPGPVGLQKALGGLWG